MSVVGIDFGNLNAVIAVARNRGIDVICNEVSNRATPSLVSFGSKQRYLGEPAKTQEISNFKSTVGSLKRMIGRSMHEREVTEVEAKYLNCDLVDINGVVGAKVMYQDKPQEFTFTQICAMYLGKIKATAEKELQKTVTDVVVSIPAYFSDAQRCAIMDAAEIAGLNILRLVHDTTASALQWGITKTDLPEDKIKYVAFVDVGQSDCTVSIAGFQKGKMMVKGVAWDRHLGGRDFDEILLDHFVEEFKTKYKIDIRSNAKALFRLRLACERVKKVLSANAQSPINVECLMNDKDVSGLVDRASFEEMIKPLVERLNKPMQRALEIAGLTKEQIESVEVIGGTTRIPAVKHTISTFFGREISTTLNQDECVSKGCALMCAIISPVFQVREFKVEDLSAFPVKLCCQNAEKKEMQETLAFAAYTPIPCTKLVTYYRREPFEVEAHYSDASVIPEGAKSWIGRYTLNNIKALPNGEPMTVKLKARLNPSGILDISSAFYLEERTVEENATPMETDDKTPAAEGEADDVKMAEAADQKKDAKDAKKKTVADKKPLPVTGGTAMLPKDKVEKLREKENEMSAADKLIIDTEERRNALEEYVYEMRGKLETNYSDYVIEADKEYLMKLLNETEDWLYGEGEDSTKSIYVSKLADLQKLGDPITKRYREEEERPAALESLRSTIREYIDLAATTDAKYEHIGQEDRDMVVKACQTKMEWIDKMTTEQSKLAKHQSPVLLVSQIMSERDALVSTAKLIMSKPKPKVEPPKTEATTSTDAPETPKPEADAPKEEANMDVD